MARPISYGIALVMFVFLTGCGTKDSAGQKGGPPPAPAAALNDNRIPTERRAAIEQAIAQQKASNEQMGQRMKAAQHH